MGNFCAIKAKGYTYKFKTEEEKKLIAFTEAIVKTIGFDKYADCLFGKLTEAERDNNRVIGNPKHTMKLQENRRKLLCIFVHKCFETFLW